MNDARRKAVASAAATRAWLWRIPLDEAVDIALANGHTQVSEAERAIIRRSADAMLERLRQQLDKPEQLEIAM
jgi:type IV pilus biogenesis protein CpaD/CtpE